MTAPAVPMNNTQALTAIILCGIILLIERAVPFIMFSKKNPPAFIHTIEKIIPPMAMTALVLYSLRDLKFTDGFTGFVPQLAGVTVTVALHLWKRNSLVSIFSGTAVCMILMRIL